MAWASLSSVIAGQLMDPAFWNQQVRDNALAVRSGGLALAGQAAGDLLIASSATQLARVAAAADSVPYYTGGTWTVARLIDLIYPVGTIYRTIVPTNPGTLFGVGTWEAFGSGRMVIGVDPADAAFNAATLTGGTKTHALTIAEMPVHTHTPVDPSHRHLQGFENGNRSGDAEFSTDEIDNYPGGGPSRVTQSKTTGITISPAGSGMAHQNLPPYLVIYRWRRTA